MPSEARHFTRGGPSNVQEAVHQTKRRFRQAISRLFQPNVITRAERQDSGACVVAQISVR